MATPAKNGGDDAQHTTFRKEIEATFAKLGQLLSKTMGPVHAKYPYVPSNDPAAPKGGLLADLTTIGYSDVKTLLQTFIDKTKGVQDDNTLLLERLVTTLSKLPADSREGKAFTDSFINDLWAALPHPPMTSLAEKYKYRNADGGNNNVDIPDLGRANTAYARSARPVAFQNIALPDPGDIFDSIMARGDKFEPHPNKISSMLFYLASIIIHDLFRTDHIDPAYSKTSSYLDLAPLYGSVWAEQKEMRTSKDGKIKPDCFSEKRLLGFPPGVGVLLIMFNRYHNYIVDRLAVINESNRFSKPESDASNDQTDKPWAQYDENGHLQKPKYDASPEEQAQYARAKYDNDLFQTGRLITCGLYINVILKDYVRTILSLNRTGTTWDLDPRAQETRTLFNTPAPEGVGNQVSAEFNLIYRWHSAISQKDEKWTEAAYRAMFPKVADPKDISLKQLLEGLMDFEKKIDKDPGKRQFANLARNPKNGTFKDDDLVEILTSSIEDVAGSFGANKVPIILRGVEVLGMMQARRWNLASLNEFRQFFGLTRHTTFEDINPDPVVAEKLRNLYDAPDFVELYPGLVAEKAKPAMAPGSGLCVNFTTSRAILSDAVSLVRGDRFYTLDYTPKNLTNWGFNEVLYDLNIDQGHVTYKLFYNAFPNHFKGNSVYAHFPFVVPDENLAILKKLGTANLYDFSKPKGVPELLVVDTYRAAVKVLNDKQTFKVTWGDAIKYMVQHPKADYGVGYCLAGDGQANAESRKLVMKALYPKDWYAEVRKFYKDITAKLIKEHSYKIGNSYQVDIVRDVAALANTHFSASLFSLPLKTEEHPHGIYTEQELYQVLSILFMAIFYDIDPSKSFLLRNAAKMLTGQLGDLCMFNVEAISKTGVIADFVAKLHTKTELTEYGIHMIQRLLEGGQSIKDVVWTQLVPTAASMVANQAQLFAQALDYYLTVGYDKHYRNINGLAKLDTPEADEKILRYFLEGGRMRATAGLFRDAAADAEIQDGDKTVKIPKGHRVLVNMVKASMDPAVFPNPEEVDLTRDIKSYIHYGWGPHQCAGLDASQTALSTMFKEVMKLDNLRMAPEQLEGVKKIPAPYGYTIYMTPDWSSFYPIPMQMKVRWDSPAVSKA